MIWLMGLDTVVRRVLVLGFLICLLLVVMLTVGFCRTREAVREERAATTKAEGRTVSAVEAIEQINDLGERSNATDAEVESATNAIRQADPADRDRVFRHRVCLLQHRTDCDGLL